MSFDSRILRDEETGLVLDLTDAPPVRRDGLDAALRAMAALEAGAIANPDEGRMVGHYWLRAPELAPTSALQAAIREAWDEVRALERGKHEDVLLVGIGGSALGPQLLADCLSSPSDPARLHFLDNTDPEGFSRVLSALDPARTLCLVISKSGGTIETRNGMLAAMAWYRDAGQPFHPHAVAITGEGSRLDRLAAGDPGNDAEVLHALGEKTGAWRARLPIWDWVGGRTSLTGPVGLVPMKLCGWDWQALLDGAAACDRATRRGWEQNPAAWLAGSWYSAGNGRGDRALVILPYRDRLLLLSRYLQQLVMESLGKRLDRKGNVVEQGLTVYGNKGSTDQHAFIQQVRDGRDDSFVHFVETTRQGPVVPADGGFLASDHLLGFQLGTGRALSGSGRPSLSIRVEDTSARSLGVLIALFERAVGLYAELVDINAYHQPGVEAGKVAAKDTLGALDRLLPALSAEPRRAAEIGREAGVDPRLAWRLLIHLSSTGRALMFRAERPMDDRFRLRGSDPGSGSDPEAGSE